MNALLDRLQPYPFERLRQLFAVVAPSPAHKGISLSKERSAIESSLHGSDTNAVRMNLHSLKGFVPIFCEPVLAQEIIQLEALGRQESLENLRPRLVNLVDRLQALENDVKLWRERFERNPTDPSLFPSV